MKIIEMLLGANREKFGVFAISVVDTPAVEENFVALSKDHAIELKEIDKEKRILLGAVLIPNQHILRKDKEGNPYYIYFSADTIAEASQEYQKNGRQSNATLQHKDKIDELTVVETWLVADEKHDKTRAFGLDYPVGTWVVAMKVDNDEIWNDYVKTGKIKGFSIEGYFTDDKTELQTAKCEDEILVEKLIDLLTKN